MSCLQVRPTSSTLTFCFAHGLRQPTTVSDTPASAAFCGCGPLRRSAIGRAHPKACHMLIHGCSAAGKIPVGGAAAARLLRQKRRRLPGCGHDARPPAHAHGGKFKLLQVSSWPSDPIIPSTDGSSLCSRLSTAPSAPSTSLIFCRCVSRAGRQQPACTALRPPCASSDGMPASVSSNKCPVNTSSRHVTAAVLGRRPPQGAGCRRRGAPALAHKVRPLGFRAAGGSRSLSQIPVNDDCSIQQGSLAQLEQAGLYIMRCMVLHRTDSLSSMAHQVQHRCCD